MTITVIIGISVCNTWPVSWPMPFVVLLRTSFPTEIRYDETLSLKFPFSCR